MFNNDHTISDIFEFAENICKTKINSSDILVSYDVTALFTNVPVDETIDIIVDIAFEDNWFNKTQKLDLTKTEFKELLVIAAKNQLFQFEGNLYEQNDGVAMGSPLGPLMANAFMSRLKEHLNNLCNLYCLLDP